MTPKELAGFNNMANTLLDIVLLFFFNGNHVK